MPREVPVPLSCESCMEPRSDELDLEALSSPDSSLSSCSIAESICSAGLALLAPIRIVSKMSLQISAKCRSLKKENNIAKARREQRLRQCSVAKQLNIRLQEA